MISFFSSVLLFHIVGLFFVFSIAKICVKKKCRYTFIIFYFGNSMSHIWHNSSHTYKKICSLTKRYSHFLFGFIIGLALVWGMSSLFLSANGSLWWGTTNTTINNGNSLARTRGENLSINLPAWELEEILERRIAIAEADVIDTERRKPKLVTPLLRKPLEFVKSIIVTDTGDKDGNIMIKINENDSSEIKILQWKLSDGVILKENLTYLIQDSTIQDCAIGFIGVITPDGSTTCLPVDPDDVDSSFDTVFQKTATWVCPVWQFLEAINQDGTLACSAWACNEDVIVWVVYPHIYHPANATLVWINECNEQIKIAGWLQLYDYSCKEWQVLRGSENWEMVCVDITTSRSSISCPTWQVMKWISVTWQPVCHDACADCGQPDVIPTCGPVNNQTYPSNTDFSSLLWSLCSSWATPIMTSTSQTGPVYTRTCTQWSEVVTWCTATITSGWLGWWDLGDIFVWPIDLWWYWCPDNPAPGWACQ